MTKFGSGLFRLILAVLVVFHHSSPLKMGACAVYTFFILSGFWICRMWRERYAHTNNPLLTYFVSRWWRLSPVFLVCTLLSVFSSFLLFGATGLHGVNGPAWWLRQLLIAGSNGAGTELPPSWTLDVEMQFYLVAPFLIMIFDRVRIFFRFLIVAAATGWFVQFILLGGNFQLAHLTLFIAFFLMGMTLEMSRWEPSSVTAMGSLFIFIGVTLILALLPSTQRGVWRAGLDAAQTPVLVSLWWIIGTAVAAPFLAWNVSQPSLRFDRFLGNLAYPLYLFHWIPCEWYYHFSLRTDPIWRQCTLLALNFLAATIGAVTILLLVDQPSDRLRAAWVGSRKKRSTVREPLA